MPPDRRIRATCLVAALACLFAAGLPEDESLRIALAESKAVAAAAARARPSVVALRALGKGRDACGSGIVVSEKGLVLTALHVVEGATAIAVVLDGGEEFPGRLRAADRARDLALLEIAAPGRTHEPARLARDPAEVGETVVAVSNPFGLGTSVSRGVLSAADRRNVVEGCVVPLLQTDAAINPGSSGGALVNLRGEVVGLITAILTRSGGHQGVGFAVPARELERAIEHLARGQPAPTPWLGIRVLEDPGGGAGLKILKVAPGGPAASAGLRNGDLLTALGGRPLGRLEDLRAALAQSNVGETLAAEVARGGSLLRLPVRVGARSSGPPEKTGS